MGSPIFSPIVQGGRGRGRDQGGADSEGEEGCGSGEVGPLLSRVSEYVLPLHVQVSRELYQTAELEPGSGSVSMEVRAHIM